MSNSLKNFRQFDDIFFSLFCQLNFTSFFKKPKKQLISRNFHEIRTKIIFTNFTENPNSTNDLHQHYFNATEKKEYNHVAF